MITELAFHDINFNVVNRNGQIWLTSAELASALQYANVRAVTGLYNRYKDEFTESMSLVLKMNTKGFGGGNSEKDTRIFSLRGAHLVAMLSKTPVAKEFRRWVLDILDKEVGEPVKTEVRINPEQQEYRYRVKVIIYDDMLGGAAEILGKADTLRDVVAGISTDLGYKPNAFTHVPMNRARVRQIH
ncbi:hypothetical protein QD57_001392 [Salmonella enterica subsp. enterica]|uniref:Bro-N domain-containing protein n=1 Tax=Salmonella enterica subsp. enterica serovar Brunei TaxID=1151177 RepID=A0A5H5QQ34_SALET|nr:BRO family protein [Salmonella enterica]EAA8256876.1 hypothetical protein [Salmonella enterica subsp. enterica]EBV5389328.1 hypothetical protein [Salmonella enterica subsp. enterica serovar Tananarive]EGZ3992310.1 hypothetical protein [Salmonella enterica subsp. enterica serovar Giza]EAA9074289.1 hypothetical protein [Salmonella enterica subsp. enterica]EAB5378223.1 hypothetical protein [Salmonella enterica subsp. enterica serovar Brunei]